MALPTVDHVSKHVPAGKRPPEDTRWRPSRGPAPRGKSSPAAQRIGGHRTVATRKVTGGLRDGDWWVRTCFLVVLLDSRAASSKVTLAAWPACPAYCGGSPLMVLVLVRPGGRRRCQNGSRWTLRRRRARLELFLALSLRIDHFALHYALAGCAGHCAPLTLRGFDSIGKSRRLLLDAHFGYFTTLRYHSPGSVSWTFFALPHMGLSARYSSCLYAPRALGVDCLVSSCAQTSHGGVDLLVAVFRWVWKQFLE